MKYKYWYSLSCAMNFKIKGFLQQNTEMAKFFY